MSEITQADRLAYAAFAQMIGRVTQKDADAILAGEWDGTADVQYFAHLREQTLATQREAYEAKLREARELIEDALPILEVLVEDRETLIGEECEIARDLQARVRAFMGVGE